MAVTANETSRSVPDAHHAFDRPIASAVRAELAWSLDDLPVAVVVFDGSHAIAVNEKWTALTGLDLAASKGEGWLTATHRNDRAALHTLPSQAVRGEDAVAEVRLAGPGGRGEIYVQARVHLADRTGPGACLMTLSEIDAHRNPLSKLVHLATHDALTGLLNRAAFMAEVDNAMRRDAPASSLTAVLFVDLDRFKEVNDRLGHQAGDTLLAVACRRIKASLRPTECAGRLGGDEIGLLCPSLASRASVVRLAERIIAALEQPFTIHEEIVFISASVGVAYSEAGESTAVELVHHADEAMYRAKAQGRAQCVVFESTEHAALARTCPTDVELALAHLAVGVAGDQREVLDLWRDALASNDESLASRLTAVSEALHTADIALRGGHTIG